MYGCSAPAIELGTRTESREPLSSDVQIPERRSTRETTPRRRSAVTLRPSMMGKSWMSGSALWVSRSHMNNPGRQVELAIVSR